MRNPLRSIGVSGLPVQLLTCALLGIASSLHAAERPKTCLVLGGGGARGAAHIGVLKVLEREHVPIDCVVGTSMGAIVGGLYAAGYRADDIEKILRGIDWKEAMSDDPSRSDRSMRAKDDDLRFLGGVQFGIKKTGIAFPQGLIEGQNLDLLLRRLFLPVWRIDDFDQLPIPFRAVAADIVSGDKVVFSHGDLAAAVRASMSIPGAFAPMRVDNRLLVDGGMVDNVPIDEARRMGAQRLIVVDVGSGMEPAKNLDSPMAIARQMLVAVLKRESDAQLATLDSDDVLITPQLDTIASQDFARTVEAMDDGEKAALALHQRLDRFGVPPADYAQWQQQRPPSQAGKPTIAFVDVPSDGSRTAEYVAHRMSGNIGKLLDAQQVEQDVTAAYGDGRYQTIGWQVEQRDDQTGLRVIPQDKSWGPNFLRSSLRLSDDFAGNSSYQLLTELSMTGLNSRGGEARARLGLGRLSNAHVEFFQPWGTKGQYSVAPYIDYRAYDIPVAASDRTNFAQFRRSDSVGGLRLAWTPSNNWSIATSLERGNEKVRLKVGDPFLKQANVSTDIGSLGLEVVHDNLDSSGFPTRGNRLFASQRNYLTALGSGENANASQISYDQAISFGANSFLFGAKYSASSGSDNIFATYSPLGGLTNLSGYTENEILADKVLFGRIVYYRRLTGNSSLVSTPLYVGGSIEAGSWGSRDINVLHQSLVPAGSIFVGVDTPLGPIFLGYGHARGDINAYYLTFGPLLRTETGY